MFVCATFCCTHHCGSTMLCVCDPACKYDSALRRSNETRSSILFSVTVIAICFVHFWAISLYGRKSSRSEHKKQVKKKKKRKKSWKQNQFDRSFQVKYENKICWAFNSAIVPIPVRSCLFDDTHSTRNHRHGIHLAHTAVNAASIYTCVCVCVC